MTDEYALIEKLRARPGMYLGTNSITALWHFINGFRFALLENGREKRGLFPLDFSFIHEYAYMLYGGARAAGWRNNILESVGGDEEKALKRFFEVFDGFKEIRADGCWRAVLSEENIAYNNGMDHGYALRGDKKESVFSDPINVYIIGLTVGAYLLAVETADGLRTEGFFYPSFEHAAGDKRFPEGAEVYFGKIDNWEKPDGLPECLI